MNKNPPPPAVRSARADDLAALLALEALFPGDRLSPRQFRHHLASPTAQLRVAHDATGVAGYALLLLRRGSTVARLYSIVVDPRWRGRGIGALLLADAEQIAREAGATRLRLEVRADNATAIALYRQRGYGVIGQRAGYYEDGADALRFERVLD